MHHNRIWGKLFWGIEWVIDLSEITSLRQLYILSFLSWELGLHRQWDWLTMNWLLDWLIDSLLSHTRFEYPLGVRHFSGFWGYWNEQNIIPMISWSVFGEDLKKVYVIQCVLLRRAVQNALCAQGTVWEGLSLRIRVSFMEVVILAWGSYREEDFAIWRKKWWWRRKRKPSAGGTACAGGSGERWGLWTLVRISLQPTPMMYVRVSISNEVRVVHWDQRLYMDSWGALSVSVHQNLLNFV